MYSYKSFPRLCSSRPPCVIESLLLSVRDGYTSIKHNRGEKYENGRSGYDWVTGGHVG